jgi:phosphoserine phosphatase RsbU/P
MPLRLPPDAEDKLRDIRSVTDAALSHLGADDLLAELLGRVREILDADTAAVLLLDNSGRQLIAAAASGLEEEVSQGVRIPVGRGFAGRIAAERRPVILDRVDHDTVLNPLLLERGIRSLAGVPLLAQGAVIGVLHVGTLRNRVFTPDDAALLQLAADRAATAVQSLRSREDQAAALALQRSLVPTALPQVRGVEVAARYVPGSGHVGGDWYDVFVLPSGELVLVVGDVAGSGLSAAVIMGRMRSALRAYALEFPGPTDVLGKLDHKMQYFEQGDVMATVSYAVLNPDSGQLRISSAGHLPPVIAAPGQHGAVAQISVDPPIGVADAPVRQITTLALVPGAVLCLFTDGLVERRDEPIDDGITRLCEAVRPGPPEDVCVSVMQALVGREYPGDDIALVVLRWQPGPPPALFGAGGRPRAEQHGSSGYSSAKIIRVAGAVVRHQVHDGVALWGRVLGMTGAVEIQAKDTCSLPCRTSNSRRAVNRSHHHHGCGRAERTRTVGLGIYAVRPCYAA